MNFQNWLKQYPLIVSEREVRIARDAWDACIENIKDLKLESTPVSASHKEYIDARNFVIDKILDEVIE
jgi:hypothetical protein